MQKAEAELFVDVLAKKGFHSHLRPGARQAQTYRVLVGPLRTRRPSRPREPTSRRPVSRASKPSCENTSYVLVQFNRRARACLNGCARAQTHFESVTQLKRDLAA